MLCCFFFCFPGVLMKQRIQLFYGIVSLCADLDACTFASVSERRHHSQCMVCVLPRRHLEAVDSF
jgi:hypothetical protein